MPGVERRVSRQPESRSLHVLTGDLPIAEVDDHNQRNLNSCSCGGNARQHPGPFLARVKRKIISSTNWWCLREIETISVSEGIFGMKRRE
jgi:hypothetical protein